MSRMSEFVRKSTLAVIAFLGYLASSGPLTTFSIWFLHYSGSGWLYAATMLLFMPLYMIDDVFSGGYGEGPFATYTKWCMQVTGTGPP